MTQWNISASFCHLIHNGPSKVNTVLEWPEPQKVKDIQSFLGFVNFYRQFISDYSKIMVPLTWLTCKGTLWDFSDTCWNSFESC